SKIEAGQMTLESVPFTPDSLLADVCDFQAAQASAKQIRLTYQSALGVPALLGDVGRLRQVLLNLVGNAVKFTEEGSVDVRGEVGVESEPGRGSTFWFTAAFLPAPAAAAAAPAAAVASAASPAAAPDTAATILVADDSLLNQRVAESMLRRLGYQVELASSGR